MSEHRDTGSVPVPVSTEAEISGRVGTAVKVAVLETKLEAVPTREQVRAEVTGAASRLEKAFDRKLEAIKPPSFWKVAAWLAGSGVVLVVTLSTIIWQASARISDLASQGVSFQREIDELSRRVGELEKKKTP